MSQEVKVGQVWRYKGSAPTTITRIDRQAGAVFFDGSGWCLQLRDDGTPQQAGWTLVQDVQPSVRKASEDRQYMSVSFRKHINQVETEKQLNDYAEHMEHWPYSSYKAKCKGCRNVDCACFTEPVAPSKPVDHCAALIATLPESEAFIESWVVEDNAPYPYTFDLAKNDLRRKASTLREWPTCPKSGVTLEITTKNQTAYKPHYDSSGQENCTNRPETFRIWTAAFHCPACSGKGK